MEGDDCESDTMGQKKNYRQPGISWKRGYCRLNTTTVCHTAEFKLFQLGCIEQSSRTPACGAGGDYGKRAQGSPTEMENAAKTGTEVASAG